MASIEPTKMFESLQTLEAVRDFVRCAYETSRGHRLPLAVAEPGPLMERAVELAGPDGLTRQELLDLFSLLGQERAERGIATMRAGGRVEEITERRPNRAGRLQSQVLFLRCSTHALEFGEEE